MNVFEDLIEELKEEQLLEETIIDLKRAINGDNDSSLHPDNARPGASEGETSGFAFQSSNAGSPEPAAPAESRQEFFKKRAMEEVSTLQMVEHVLSGIEREYMRMAPEPFDDLEVKKALHRFLQLLGEGEVANETRTDAERDLANETERWFLSLTARDANISVANIRRFCENSRPALSSQALIAFARFYRNSPFTEAVRGKFDFIITRLFTRDEEDKRKPLFAPVEMTGHLKTLYSNWSSVTMFGSPEDAARIAATVGSFRAFAAKAEEAQTFDALVADDFLNGIRRFKEDIGEMFLVVDVAAAAIDCNVRIGNRFVDLVKTERQVTTPELVEAKYGYSFDTVISTAACKTILLVDLLKDEEKAEAVIPRMQSEPVKPAKIDFERAPVEDSRGIFGVNKWVLILSLLMLITAGGIYFWSENATQNQGEISVASTVQVSDPDLRQHLQMARISNETLYGVAQPTWVAQSEDEQKELLRKALLYAQSIKLKQVSIVNNTGRSIGFASASRVEVLTP